MKESKFQKKVVEALKAKGAWILNVHGHKMQKSGVPDLQVVHRRWCGYLELKVEKKKCSPIQKQVIKNIKDRHFPVFVLRKEKEFCTIRIENENGEFLDRCWYDSIIDKLAKLSEERI